MDRLKNRSPINLHSPLNTQHATLHFSSFILYPLVAVIAASLISRAAFARPDLTRRVAPRPVAIELLDGQLRAGGLVGLEEKRVQPAVTMQPASGTPASLSERLPGMIQVALDKGPARLPTAEIRRFIFRPTERIVFRSDATVKTLYLGFPPDKKPEPAGWYQPETAIEQWEPAALQSPYYRWRYIPQACWVWAKRSGRPRDHETVLFRHEFFVPTTATLVSARLDVGADDQIESFFINGASVPIPTHSLVGKISQWDVTYLLRPGRNLMAARVTNLPSSEQLNYTGFCYRIVCDVLDGAGKPNPSAPGVRLRFTNGDRLSGDLENVSSGRWVVRCGGRVVEVDPAWIDLALVNYREAASGRVGKGAQATGGQDRKSLLSPLKGILSNTRSRPVVTLSPQPAVAWDQNIEPVASAQGIQARNGEWIEGRIEALRANRIQIKPRYGETFEVTVDRIAFLQPDRPEPAMQFLFHPADFPAIVRVRLANNDLLTGALESLSPYFVTITPQFSKPIRLDLDEVLSIHFVMNATARSRQRISRAWPAQMPRQVAAIGESDSAAGPGKDRTILAIQRTLINLGLQMQWLGASQMVTPGMLTPERFPVLINLDQNEHYFYAVRAQADGFEAIRRYALEGGSLVHLARGVPFSLAYIPEKSRWKTIRPNHDLNALLLMDIATPDRRSAEARPFQLPPNKGQHMMFVLDRQSPFADGLPDEVEMPMIADARFRPITDDR